ncbi:TetR family transcriptional regulator [Mycolicibacterium hodleri]|uniref:TetR family transcriptional regulator n=1 Tax=Mycolicibacterium hodleri TaxID=49897 RepID=A0A502EI17_9MYCO|nr:TetR family transcriptional regulator [Mycolicibacterium hodleri]TPG36729.1 TetR family transcriptional regulator [Mycolicibacterium hodleri]
MSSSAVTHVTRLRDPHSQRTLTCRRVFGAAAAMLDDCARPDVSVPALAARARIAPAALRAHFPSMDAMYAELYLARVIELPLVVDQTASIQARVSGQLCAITLIMADETRLAVACTQALLRNDDAAITRVQSLIAAEVRRRLSAALGTGAWPEVLATLETVFWGALLQVQSSAFTYRTMANRLDVMVSLILPEG